LLNKLPFFESLGIYNYSGVNKDMKQLRIVILFCLVILICSACNASSKESGAAKVVASFYHAIVNQERDQVGTIACAAWEKTALREIDAFMGVKAELSNVTCSVKETNGDTASVICTGKIAASYGNEITDFPLDGRIHTVVKEQGEWRLCGY
jgi:hypothetical protein